VVQYLDEDENEVAAAESLVTDVRPSGLLFLGGNVDKFRAYASRLGETFPAVVLTNSMAGLDKPAISSVTTDDHAAAKLAVSHLVANGHTQIGIIGGNPEVSTTSRLRLEGAMEALAARNLDFDRALQLVPTRYALDCGYDAAQQLIARCPDLTAIYAMSDNLAIGALRAFADFSIPVPDRISLIGHDGIELASYTTPRLVTIRQPQAELAARGTQLLLRHIEGDHTPSYETTSVELVPGESVRAVR
jgi:LacI family transcriptional regulator